MKKLQRYPFRVYVLLIVQSIVVSEAIWCDKSFSQSTSNQSTVENSAAPSASSVTTGGTNVNTQVNNAYANDINFGGGITCRTPNLFVTGNTSRVGAYQRDPLQKVINNNNSYGFTAGVIIPFGSKINDHCKDIASEIAKDRKIASELSMIRACDDLLKKDIYVDPAKFPLLAPCAEYRETKKSLAQIAPKSNPNSSNQIQLPFLKPLTDRAL